MLIIIKEIIPYYYLTELALKEYTNSNTINQQY